MLHNLVAFGRPILAEPVKHILRWWQEPDYRIYQRLAAQMRSKPRHTPFSVRFNGFSAIVPDSASFLSTYRDLFLNRIYAFRFEGEAPRILDLGANIGISVLAFKRQYPRAQITAVEADPELFSYLSQNVTKNKLDGVELINRAVWNENTTLLFQPDNADGGRIILLADSQGVEIESIDVRELLSAQRYDFIKMDIEGAERIVLPACVPYLEHVQYLFVEYHDIVNQSQAFVEMIDLMASAGYRLSIDRVWGSDTPFCDLAVNDAGMDFQVNIFGWRE